MTSNLKINVQYPNTQQVFLLQIMAKWSLWSLMMNLKKFSKIISPEISIDVFVNFDPNLTQIRTLKATPA